MVTKRPSDNGQFRVKLSATYTEASGDDWTCSGEFCWQFGKALTEGGACRMKFSSGGHGLTIECYNKGHDPSKNPTPDTQGQSGSCTDC